MEKINIDLFTNLIFSEWLCSKCSRRNANQYKKVLIPLLIDIFQDETIFMNSQQRLSNNKNFNKFNDKNINILLL